MTGLDTPSDVLGAFADFLADQTRFALLLAVSTAGELQKDTLVFFSPGKQEFEDGLARLESHITPTKPLYIILRREGSLIAITYVPYLAEVKTKELLLSNRHSLVHALGEEHFSLSLICKERAEVYDHRSWAERDTSVCARNENVQNTVQDLGYQQNKCRLCDQRMKNEIEDAACEALGTLGEPGACVQLSLDISTLVLRLAFQRSIPSPSDVSDSIPSDHPSYTFYRHPATSTLYFIYCSPDEAPVKARMSSMMAMFGLVRITAKEKGVEVDQKIEIHEAGELDFAEGDERIGKLRSMYLLNRSGGTESQWEGMEK